MKGQPKRLIEVDLPIKRISEHARREKSIRHGHISTLHIWWARRPLAACRAVICAALWLDPVDPLCPQQFRDVASRLINKFAQEVTADKELAAHCSHESWTKWQKLSNSGGLDSTKEAHWNVLRFALLDFIADFANWDNSSVQQYLETSQGLTQVAHEALGGSPGTKPLIVDPFAGGGSIPLEALRVGADTFASDLNPVAVLLNKVVLEYIPKYGQRLADEIRKWGEWIKREAEKELAEFYPKDMDGATPIAYLWSRTIQCEGPSCGAEVPLIRSLWLARKGKESVALRIVPHPKKREVEFEIIECAKAGDVKEGTVKRGSATCPCCGFTTPVASVRRQLKKRRGGAADSRMVVVRQDDNRSGERSYRLPRLSDLRAVELAGKRLQTLKGIHGGPLSLVPNEKLDNKGIRHTWAMIYGIAEWGDVFTPRQALALSTFVKLIRETGEKLCSGDDPDFERAVQTCLALALDRLADFNSSVCVLNSVGGRGVVHTFGRQALPMVWDFMETNPFNEVAANWMAGIEAFESTIRTERLSVTPGRVERCSAATHILPSAAASAFITDPPYYDAVPYAYLSDFFYVWLRRSLANAQSDLLRDTAVPKDEEIVVDRPHELSDSTHDIAFYEAELAKAFGEGRRVLQPGGIGTIVFASKTTASWEAVLRAIIDAGLVITGSWPIDTEREARIAAQGQARLGSSIHIICRPRENPDGSVQADEIGDWRDVLHELPRRIHDWMPRLAEEGVVGADAIFACLGPALEIFSRYRSVEKANGQIVALREYLEHVWAAVAKEALAVVFKGADASGFEEDARLTAMWLWTLFAGQSGTNGSDEETDEDEESEESGSKPKGYVLEYDAARKIAQGLGAHLETLPSLVEIKGETATLLSVAERTRILFGKDESESPTKARKKKKAQFQLGFISELEQAEEAGSWGSKGAPSQGATVLDRVHQSMILFAADRSEALRRFLVDEGVGSDERFWRLAQVLSFLYPKASDEKRWIDGVLARKKGLGF